MTECKRCKHDIPENEDVKIVGTATVYGNTTLKKFKEEGVIWYVSDSENEEVICPYCGEPTPIGDF